MLSKFEEEEEAKKNAEKERVEKEVTAVDDTNNVPQQSRKSEGWGHQLHEAFVNQAELATRECDCGAREERKRRRQWR